MNKVCHDEKTKQKHSHSNHIASLSQELACHLPYATFSVAMSFVALSFFHFLTVGFSVNAAIIQHGYHTLFHAFHYLHLVFAVVGTFVAFSRFSNNMSRSIIISIISPIIFCTLSDIALPAIIGMFLGVITDVHICFFSVADTLNIIPFIVMGLITGFAIARHHQPSLHSIALTSHFVHILISSLAATFYIASYGFSQWHTVMGPLFALLVIAIVTPCTLSDVVIPLYFSQRKSMKNENN